MACAPAEVSSEPTVEMTADLRTEVADRRAAGYSWFSIGAALRRNADAVRRAAAADPLFPAALAAARAEAVRDAEGDALGRLRLLTNGEDPALALRAAQTILAFGSGCRRDDNRLAVERLRAETQQRKLEARAAKAAKAEVEEAPRPRFAPIPVPTAAECAEMRERGALEAATKPGHEVYLWGGQHVIGSCHQPDDTDTRVSVYQDYSVNRGGNTVLWVVPRAAFEASNRAGGRPITPADIPAPPPA